MSKDALNIISESMKALGLAYGFGEYSADPVVYPYFVGVFKAFCVAFAYVRAQKS